MVRGSFYFSGPLMILYAIALITITAQENKMNIVIPLYSIIKNSTNTDSTMLIVIPIKAYRKQTTGILVR